MSRQVVGAVTLGLVIVMSTISGSRGIEPKSEKGVLAGLKVGQPITV